MNSLPNRGDLIEVTDAGGVVRSKRVLASAEGSRFLAVWACSEEEWAAAQGEGREPDAEPFPWPLDSARLVVAA
jgi:hypothetical protein